MDAYKFLDSIGLLVDSKIAELQLDSTIVCKITDNSKHSSGIYTVTYGGSSFVVNSADFSLEKDDQVYVGIPQGDYTNAYIISKKIDEAKKVSNGSPFYNFIKELEISASGLFSDDKGRKIFLWGEKQEASYPFVNINNFKKLGISGQVFINEKDLTQSFGLKVYINTKRNVNGQVMDFMQTIEFDCGKKLNGIYQENTWIEFQELFDISEIDNIVSFSMEIFAAETIKNNISFKDIKIYFGGLKEEYKEEGMVLYTNNTLDYDSDSPKEVFLRFVYKENNETKIITSLTPEEAIPNNLYIKWFFEGAEVTAYENKWHFITNKLNVYKDEIKCEAIISYNDVQSVEPKIYKNAIYFKNIGGKNNIFSTGINCELTANKTSFGDVYHADGTIIDFSLVRNPKDYRLFLTANPFLASYNNDLVFKIQYVFPFVTNTAIGFDKQYIENINKTKAEDDFEWKIEQSSETQLTTITKQLRKTNGSIPDLGESETMPYIISDNYLQNMTNNTVICRLIAEYNEEIVETYEKTLTINFLKTGVCKTDFVLCPTLTDEQGNVTRSIKYYQGILNVHVDLCDSLGNKIEISNDVKWEWYGRDPQSEQELILNPIGKDGCQIVTSPTLTQLAPSVKNYSYILKASYDTIKNNKINTHVECLIPIGINTSGKLSTDELGNNIVPVWLYEYIQGPTTVIYDTNGGQPSFYSSNYSLLNSAQQEIFGDEVEWECLPPPFYSSNTNIQEKNKTYYPSLQEREGKYYLVAPSLYTKGAEGSVFIAKTGNEIRWIQPILSYQTSSFSSFINDWDGKLSIDEANNSVMAARLGAGSKDEQGKFSGVLLGDWTEQIEDKSVTKTGIYGYDHGAQSYGFREDGTAFIGKSGTGRIEFDGNEGIIQSANFDGEYNLEEHKFTNYGKAGSYWNLKDGQFLVTNGIFRGALESNSGTLGGWKITEEGLSDESQKIALNSYGFADNTNVLPERFISVTVENNEPQAKFVNIDNLDSVLIYNKCILKLNSEYSGYPTCQLLSSLFQNTTSHYSNEDYSKLKTILKTFVYTLDLSLLMDDKNKTLSDYWKTGMFYDAFEGSLALTTFRTPYPFIHTSDINITDVLVEKVFKKYLTDTEKEIANKDDLPRINGVEYRGQWDDKRAYVYKFNTSLTNIEITGFILQEELDKQEYLFPITQNFKTIKIYNQNSNIIIAFGDKIPIVGHYTDPWSVDQAYGPHELYIYGKFEFINDFIYYQITDNIQDTYRVLWCDNDVRWKCTLTAPFIRSWVTQDSVDVDSHNTLEILRLPTFVEGSEITENFFAGCNNVRSPIILLESENNSLNITINNLEPATTDNNRSTYLLGKMKQVPYFIIDDKIYAKIIKTTSDAWLAYHKMKVKPYNYLVYEFNKKAVYSLQGRWLNELKEQYFSTKGLETIMISVGDIPLKSVTPINPSNFMVSNKGTVFISGIQIN